MAADRQQRINECIRQDPFARMMGATVEILGPGHSRATVTVTDDLGGITTQLVSITLANVDDPATISGDIV